MPLTESSPTEAELEALPRLTVGPRRVYTPPPGTSYWVAIGSAASPPSIELGKLHDLGETWGVDSGDDVGFGILQVDRVYWRASSCWPAGTPMHYGINGGLVEPVDIEFMGPDDEPPVVYVLEEAAALARRAAIAQQEADVKAEPWTIELPSSTPADLSPKQVPGDVAEVLDVLQDPWMPSELPCGAPGPGGRICVRLSHNVPSEAAPGLVGHRAADGFTWPNSGLRESYATPTEDLLTADEREAIDQLGKIAGLLARVIRAGGDDDVAAGDINEAVGYVHVLQKMVMGQAAARAYPNLYRRLGARIPRRGAVL